MGCDMVVALKEASVNGATLFGLNHYGPRTQRHQLQRVHGASHDLGEMLRFSGASLPQVRQTCLVLGVQPAGQWGFIQGINEHRLAMGVTHWRSRLCEDAPALCGHDLVRLTLERSHSARQAVDTVTDLIGRHGEGPAADSKACDNIFLIADPEESYVVEATGRFWALIECRHTRVVTDTAMIRQDWHRLSPGLADHVIHKGWWPDDGSKVDFVRCLVENTEENRIAQRRWGRASLALAQQQGAIDLPFLRRMLAEHHDNNLDLLPQNPPVALTNTFLADLQKSNLPVIAWVAFGAPSVAVHFPISLQGELPAAFRGGHPECPTIEQRALELEKLASAAAKDRNKVAQALERLQTRYDQDAEDFLVKAHDCVQRNNHIYLAQLATEMMHRHAEAFEKEYRRLLDIKDKTPQPVQESEEMLYFA